MKILVTGGTGYIGSHTCIELINAGYEVVVADNLSNSCEEVINRINIITGKNIDFIRCNICDYEALENIFCSHEIDGVIHFAGYKSVSESVREPIKYYTNNLVSTMNLVMAMRKYGVNNLIFSSSATVYGNPVSVPICEEFSIGGTTNPYGTTKLFAEQILLDCSKAFGELNIIILRYFNPIGAHSSGMIGEDSNDVPNNLVPYIAQVAIGKLKELRIFGNDYPTKDGTGVRDYIHVVDLAKGHVAALNNINVGESFKTYNLGTGQGYSVLDVLHAYEKACGKKIPYVIDVRRPGDVAECYSNPSKAYEELGWKAKLGIDEMCVSSWNWQKNNPNGYR